jgi:hypothetical protein
MIQIFDAGSNPRGIAGTRHLVAERVSSHRDGAKVKIVLEQPVDRPRIVLIEGHPAA